MTQRFPSPTVQRHLTNPFSAFIQQIPEFLNVVSIRISATHANNGDWLFHMWRSFLGPFPVLKTTWIFHLFFTESFGKSPEFIIRITNVQSMSFHLHKYRVKLTDSFGPGLRIACTSPMYTFHHSLTTYCRRHYMK